MSPSNNNQYEFPSLAENNSILVPITKYSAFTIAYNNLTLQNLVTRFTSLQLDANLRPIALVNFYKGEGKLHDFMAKHVGDFRGKYNTPSSGYYSFDYSKQTTLIVFNAIMVSLSITLAKDIFNRDLESKDSILQNAARVSIARTIITTIGAIFLQVGHSKRFDKAMRINTLPDQAFKKVIATTRNYAALGSAIFALNSLLGMGMTAALYHRADAKANEDDTDDDSAYDRAKLTAILSMTASGANALTHIALLAHQIKAMQQEAAAAAAAVPPVVPAAAANAVDGAIPPRANAGAAASVVDAANPPVVPVAAANAADDIIPPGANAGAGAAASAVDAANPPVVPAAARPGASSGATVANSVRNRRVWLETLRKKPQFHETTFDAQMGRTTPPPTVAVEAPVAARSSSIARTASNASRVVVPAPAAAGAVANLVDDVVGVPLPVGANPARGLPAAAPKGVWTARGLAVLGSVLGGVQAVLSITTLLPALDIDEDAENLTEAQRDAIHKQKEAVKLEMGVQAAGAALQIFGNLLMVLQASKVALAFGGALLAGVGALAVTLSPLAFASIDAKEDYAEDLRNLANEMQSTNPNVDSASVAAINKLAGYYEDVAEKEELALGINAGVAGLSGVITLLMLAAGAGGPVTVVVGLVMAGVALLVSALLQWNIDNEIDELYDHIQEKGGAGVYFGEIYDSDYQYYLSDNGGSEYLKSLQAAYKVDQVVGITSITMSATSREEIAKTSLAEEVSTNKTYIDIFDDGIVLNDASGVFNVDVDNGIINIIDFNENSQLLEFTTPLLSAGEERERSGGKNANTEIIIRPKGWTINDGASSTTVLMQNMVLLVEQDNGTEITIPVYLNMGKGDDTIYASAAMIDADASDGNDTISYEHFGATSKIHANLDTGVIIKTLVDEDVYKESIETEEHAAKGKSTESIDYRTTEVVKYSGTMIDLTKNFENVIGSEGHDTIIGNMYDNILIGRSGIDRLSGAGGNDTFVQEARINGDHISGGEGSDTVDYSMSAYGKTIDFNEIYIFDSRKLITVTEEGNIAHVDIIDSIERIIGSSGNDHIIGDESNNIFIGGEGNDYLSGRDGNDYLHGGDGFNTIEGGGGRDYLVISDTASNSVNSKVDGGDDEDTFAIDAKNSNYSIDLNSGILSKKIEANHSISYSVIANLVNIENVIGSTGNDELFGDKKNNLLDGSQGNDKLYGRDGDDRLTGGNGNNTLDGGEGFDYAMYTGTEYVDSYSNLGVIINLNQGFSTQKPYSSALFRDELISIEAAIGSYKNDEIIGNDSSVSVLNGLYGDDVIRAGKNGAVIIGGLGYDMLYGGLGNDTFYQTTNYESDHIYGEEGNNSIEYTIAGDSSQDFGIRAYLNEGIIHKGTIEGKIGVDYISNIQNISGTNHNDEVKGDSNDNRLIGNDGDDILYGYTGDDVLSDGSGRDWLYGGEGADNFNMSFDYTTDLIDGGDGLDTVNYTEDQSTVFGIRIELHDKGGATSTLNPQYKNAEFSDIFTSIENVVGSISHDSISSTLTVDSIISGANGNDFIEAGFGNDILLGDHGDDIIFGRFGDDQFSDDEGDDLYDGGEGNDVFLIEKGANKIYGKSGDDSIVVMGSVAPKNNLYDGGQGQDQIDYSLMSLEFSGRYVLFYFGFDVDLTDAIVEIKAKDNNTNLVTSDNMQTGSHWIQIDLGASHSLEEIYFDPKLHATPYTVYVGNSDMRNLSQSAIELIPGIAKSYKYSDSSIFYTKVFGQGIDAYLNYNRNTSGSKFVVGTVHTNSVLKEIGFLSDQFVLDQSLFKDSLVDIENIKGTKFNDTFRGDEFNNTLDGGAGDDIIFSESGNDSLFGDAGNDDLYAGQGNDFLSGGSGDDKLYGDAGDDVIDGGNGNNLLYGEKGNDIFYITPSTFDGKSINFIDGGNDFDYVTFELFNSAITYDATSGRVGENTLVNIEAVAGTRYNDWLIGGLTNDRLLGASGDDALTGAAGNDLLYGEAGSDTLEGGTGDDILLAGLGNDIIMGGDGTDWIGQFLLESESDVIDGGEGLDTLDYSLTDLSDSGINLLHSSQAPQNVGADYRIAEMFGIRGSVYNHPADSSSVAVLGSISSADLAFWEATVNLVKGNTYQFTYRALTNSIVNTPVIQLFVGDKKQGQAISVDPHDGWYSDGYETIEFVAEETGEVKLKLKNLTQANYENYFTFYTNELKLSRGVDVQLFADLAFDKVIKMTKFGNINDKIYHVENIIGNSLDDTFFGTNEDNLLSGMSGNDSLTGRDGDDTLLGGKGNDTLFGNAGDDLFLQSGTLNDFDQINGGDGVDTVNYSGGLLVGRYIMIRDHSLDESSNFNPSVFNVNVTSENINPTYNYNNTNGWAQIDLGASVSIDSIEIEFSHLTHGYSVYVADFDMSALSAPYLHEQVNLSVSHQTLNATKVTLQARGILANLREQNIFMQSNDFINTKHHAVSSIENVAGTLYDDTLIGDVADNVLSGDAGNDSINGDLGNDLLLGGAGVDTVFGGDGDDIILQDFGSNENDTLDGGIGFDMLDYGSIDLGGFIDLDMKNNKIDKFSNNGQFVGVDSIINIEHIKGGWAADHLFGDINSNTLSGGNGNDTINGGEGDDVLLGGEGNDTINGEEGDDTIIQEFILNSNDNINGGDGIDLLDYSASDLKLLEANFLTNGHFESDAFSPKDTELYYGYLAGTTVGSAMVINDKGDPEKSYLQIQGASEGKAFWSQSVVLDEGVHYSFSYRVAGTNLNGESLQSNGLIQLFVNGIAQGAATQVTSVHNDWYGVLVEFKMPSGGEAKIELKDLNGSGKSSSFVVDQLSLTELAIKADLSNTIVEKYVTNDASVDRVVSFEDITGTDLADVLIGDDADNKFVGRAGNDKLSGQAGDDVLWGGDGKDILSGGDGNDTLIGGADVDTLSGGAGNDLIVQTVELTGSETVDGGVGDDTVDYSAGMLFGRYIMIRRTSSQAGAFELSNMAVVSEGLRMPTESTTAKDGSWVQLDLGLNASIDAIYLEFAANPSAYSVHVGATDMSGLIAGSSTDKLYGVAIPMIELTDGLAASRQSGTSTQASFVAGGIAADLSRGTVVKNFTGFVTSNDRLYGVENLVGTAYNDKLTGDTNANTLSGGDGNDTLSGSAGDDVLMGGAGGDRLLGGEGNDIILQAIEAGVTDRIDGGAGIDGVDYSQFEAPSLIWNGDFDYLLKAQEDTDYDIDANGLTGTERVTITSAISHEGWQIGGVNGGDDYFLAADGAATENPSLFWKQAVRLIAGATYRLTFLLAGTSVNPAQIALSVGGIPVMPLGVVGQAGEGWQEVEVQFTSAFTGDVPLGLWTQTPSIVGNDFAIDKLSLVSIQGVDANLSTKMLTKYDGAIDTLENIENLTGSIYADRLTGDAKANTLMGLAGDDQLQGQEGDDILNGGAGHDTLFGGGGNDALYGEAGNDTLYGDEGDDLFVSGLGNDTLSGGNGTDTVDYSGSKLSHVGLIADLLNKKVYKNGSDASNVDTLESVENVVGTALADTLLGDANTNVLKGGAGNDQLHGGTGADTLLGDEGDDTIVQDWDVQMGDTIDGGAGIDTVDYSQAGEPTNLENLIRNADFDATQALAAMADTDYPIVSGSPPVAGAVGITPMMNFVDGSSTLGVTGGGDAFLAVNGSIAPNRAFWKQRVSLEPGATYQFDYMLAGSNTNGAEIRFWVNGQVVGSSTKVAGVDAGWQKVQVQFVAQAAASVEIALSDWTLSDFGNDFAIDKLSLTKVQAPATGIVADLSAGTVYKNGNFAAVSVDRLQGIENVVGTALADSLKGNANANVLTGGTGNDVYQFGRGDGQDTVVDTDALGGNTDTIAFASGLRADQLWFSRMGNDLSIAIIGSNDAIKVQDWYRGTNNQVEKLTLADGGTLLSSSVNTLVQAMANFAAPIAGQTTLPPDHQLALASVIASTWK